MLVNPLNSYNQLSKIVFRADEPQSQPAQSSGQEILQPATTQTQPIAMPILQPAPQPTVQILPAESPKDKGIFKKTVDFFRALCKFNVATQSYLGGVINGFVGGTVAGAAMMAASWTLSSAARVGRKEEKMATIFATPFKLFGKSVSYLGTKLWNLPNASIKSMVKYIVKTPYRMAKSVSGNTNINGAGKVLTFTAFGTVFVYHIFRSILRANQQKANIDHKLVNTPILNKN